MTLRPALSCSKGQSGEDIVPSSRLPCGSRGGAGSLLLLSGPQDWVSCTLTTGSTLVCYQHGKQRLLSRALQRVSYLFISWRNLMIENTVIVSSHILFYKKKEFYSFWVKNILKLFLNFSHLFSRLIFWNRLCSRWRNENGGDHSLEEASLFTMACNFCLTTLFLKRLTIDY